MPPRATPSNQAAELNARPDDITDLLHRWGNGDRAAFDQIVPIVYDRLREIARHHLRAASTGSVNTTGLVHDAYLKLVEAEQIELRDRGHFLAFSSRVMRNVLTDQVRARAAARRGGGVVHVPVIDELVWLSEDEVEAVSALDDALERLAAFAPRQTQILEQRYFGGLSLEETAEVIGVSLATVKRELRSARAWLAAELGGDRVL